MKIALPLFLILTSGSVSFATNAARLSQEDNVREAVFRHQFNHNASGQQKNAGVYCLAVGEKEVDPSDEFMKRFADQKPPVQKASECQIDRVEGVIDRRTGALGVIFYAGGIKWISGTEVKVAGGYYEANLSSSGNTYTVAKRHGKWKVSNDKMLWISQSSSHFDFLQSQNQYFASNLPIGKIVRFRQ